MSDYTHSAIYQNAFHSRKGDISASSRTRLQTAIARMREQVSSLLTMVPTDCKDLTVHDVTHLDALWEMASLLSGNCSDLNPAEVFVLGSAILLHDAGLTTAAYPEGLEEIKKTPEWTDIAAAYLRQSGTDVSTDSILNPPAQIFPSVKFAVLRALHAKQAESMAVKPWTLPGGDQLFLIEDIELRQAFGASIGRIAHSHHWNIDKVAEALETVGAGTVLPAEWSVNERKVACYLRCADACHMDRRRAPTFLYAATKPSGLSEIHWRAQNKMNKPTVKGTTIVFTSGQPFHADDAEAWWLVHDLVRTADNEIRSSNALLEEVGAKPFVVQRVLGAESPRSLASQVRVDGWRPIDAEIRVSDPVHLARSLGGRNLYGEDALAPIRELLQNAADAIRARRQIEERPDSWGEIHVTIEPAPNSDRSCWLHVDDNGIGMSERVLSGPLIDFGKSIWNSSLLREEFPGLESKSLRPVGKFGIGFFSVFELANEVKVISKHYQAAMSDAKVLEFRSLDSRPLIRAASSRELPRDVSTRVSLFLQDRSTLSEFPSFRSYLNGMRVVERPDLRNRVAGLVSMLNVRVEYFDRLEGKNFSHSPAVYDISVPDFIDEVYPDSPQQRRDLLKRAYSSIMRPLADKDGKLYGRAAIEILSSMRSNDNICQVSVGGFVTSGYGAFDAPVVGVIEGDTNDAARIRAKAIVPEAVRSSWASQQAELILAERDHFRSNQLLRACTYVRALGGDPGGLPYCFNQGKLIDFYETQRMISDSEILVVPLILEYQSRLKLRIYQNLRSDYFQIKLKENVFFICSEDENLLDEEMTRPIVKDRKSILSVSEIKHPELLDFISLARNGWKSEPVIEVGLRQLFDSNIYSLPEAGWTIVLRRSS